MNAIKSIPVAAVALPVASISATMQAKDRMLAGCYKPVSGFAMSVCNDGESCDIQAGVYKIVLKNAQAIYGQRVLLMSGACEGRITIAPHHCAGATT